MDGLPNGWRPSRRSGPGSLLDYDNVRYTRGRVTVLDRAGLEAAACACHQRVRSRYERLLGGGVFETTDAGTA